MSTMVEKNWQRSRSRLLQYVAAMMLLALAVSCAPVPRQQPLPERAVELSPEQPGYALYLQGRQQERAGDLAGAIKAYLEAATVNPDQPKILEALGLAYLQTGDHRTARMHLERAAGLAPDSPRLRMGLGYAALQRADYQEAIRQLEQSVALRADVRNQFLLAEALAKSGRTGAALDLYQHVAAEDRWGKLGKAAARRADRLEKEQ